MTGIETRVEAKRVVLAPIDTEQIHTFGWRVNHSVINPKVVKDEKRELLGTLLQEGRIVNVVYSFGRHPVTVSYTVEDVEPPNSYMGDTTVVEILGEEPNGTPLFSPDRVRDTLQRNLKLLEEDLALARGEGLPTATLEAQAAALIESLQRIF